MILIDIVLIEPSRVSPYPQTMGILYNVKFQIYHEDAWEHLMVGADESPSTPLMHLSRLLEILEIVDVRRKKLLQIQTQLTRHVAVLKYHRHYQDKDFPVRVLVDV